jgi:hypothetical protein
MSDRPPSELQAFRREKLKAARELRLKVFERRLHQLKVFVGDDAALVRVYREQHENVREFPEVVEAATDDVLCDAKAERDRIFPFSRLRLHAADPRRLRPGALALWIARVLARVARTTALPATHDAKGV